jgi:hypothetical protein
MSLKAFHVVFITAASILAFGFGTWLILQSRGPGGTTFEFAGGIASFVVGVALLVYERFFLKKLKHVSYL